MKYSEYSYLMKVFRCKPTLYSEVCSMSMNEFVQCFKRVI